MTIYKWWPSKGVLALEGCAASVDSVFAMPDTGDITADLTTHLTTFVGVLRDTITGRVIRELLGQAQTDPCRRTHRTRSPTAPTRTPVMFFQSSIAEGHDRYFKELAALLEQSGNRPSEAAMADLRRHYDTEQITAIHPGD